MLQRSRFAFFVILRAVVYRKASNTAPASAGTSDLDRPACIGTLASNGDPDCIGTL